MYAVASRWPSASSLFALCYTYPLSVVLYGCVTIGIGVRVFALCYTYPLSVVLYCALYCVAFMYASHSLLKPAVV